MNNVRNIVLIGRTGNGKSTLGNVLINKNNNFEVVFKESGAAVSQTRYVSEANFWYNGLNYRVIDTIGIGDTSLSEKEVLYRIAEAAYKVRDGLSQILFVTSGRFTNEEIFAYNLLRKFIFDGDIVNYTTIVRTNFPNFRNYSKCEEDKKLMKEENSGLKEIITSCGNRVIHVDNPSLNIDDERRLALNKEDRENSRTKLLSHLAQFQISYKPTNLDYLNSRISNHMTDIERLQHELIDEQKSNKLSEEQKRSMQKTINELQEKVYQETNSGYLKQLGKHADTVLECAGEFLREKCVIM